MDVCPCAAGRWARQLLPSERDRRSGQLRPSGAQLWRLRGRHETQADQRESRHSIPGRGGCEPEPPGPRHRGSGDCVMELRNLGHSGLRVSSIGLGCNNFGGRIDLAATRLVVHKALDEGITLFDTADVYGERGGSETCLGQIPRRHPQAHRARVQVRHADGRCRYHARRVPPLHRRGGGRQPEAPAHRLAGSLSDASARSIDSDRGDSAHAGRPRAVRQDALCPAVPTCRLAGCGGAMDRTPARPQRLRLMPGRIQPAGPRSCRGSADAGHERVWPWACYRSSRWRRGFSPESSPAMRPVRPIRGSQRSRVSPIAS